MNGLGAFWFHIFGMLEFASMTWLVLVLFRQPVAACIPQVIFLSVLMSNASYYIRKDLVWHDTAAALCLITLTVLFYTYMLHMSIFQSLISSIITNMYAAWVHSMYLLLYTRIGTMALSEMTFFSWEKRWVQGSVIVTTIFAAWIVYRYRLGFTFISGNFRSRPKPVTLLYTYLIEASTSLLAYITTLNMVMLWFCLSSLLAGLLFLTVNLSKIGKRELFHL
ncbi:hypothetical protein [Marinicrinis lubricantis]|uniref:Uncharacterized protein n=1 Tax=Marinicrinis lubricantis TaxID=2086470 RepID=A0ABW1IT14_9BACL